MSDDTRPNGSVTVLVIEDHLAVQRAIALLLEDSGYRVLTAGDGEEAMQILGKAESIDLVLADLELPGCVKGLEAAQEVQRRYPHSKVLLMSGYPRDKLVSSGKIGEDMTYLSKPFLHAELERRIQRLLRA